MALLEARGLVKQYGRRTVVNGVSIDVNAGEVVGLLGPNGAGKTTSFRMIAGMIAPNAGEVTFNGRDVTNMPMYQRARLGMGYLAQEGSIFRKLTVEQNLFTILEMMTTRRGKPYRSTSAQRRQRVDELLVQFGLTHIRKNIASLCSGGEKRRLEIARCLLSEPMLIMLDEPFTGIDPKTVGDIQVIIRQLRDQEGIGILITDHHAAETLRITDRSYLVASGNLLTHGTPIEIINDSRAREVYLGENFAAGLGEELIKPVVSPIRALLDTEEIFDLINKLAGDDYELAAGKIRARGQASVELLLQALERPEAIIRQRAHALLCEVLCRKLPFDHNAGDIQRLQQIHQIREWIAPARAG